MTGDMSDHPEIEAFSRAVERRFDLVLEAEQEAALVGLNRAATLRDRLIEWEDRHSDVTVTTVAGTHSGRLAAVGIDHLVLVADASRVVVRLADVIAVSEP